jgi:hypothetical protein
MWILVIVESESQRLIKPHEPRYPGAKGRVHEGREGERREKLLLRKGDPDAINEKRKREWDRQDR